MTLLHVRRHVVRQRSCGPPPPAFDVADALSRLDIADAGGIWLIRRLDVHAAVGTGASPAAAAGALAQKITRAVEHVLDAGPGQPGVLWYPGRPAFLAQWIVDLSRDRVAGRWEYAEFGTAPLSAAVRERAGAEPGAVLAALRALPADDLGRVMTLLAPADAAAIVHAVALRTGSGDAAAVARAVAVLRDSGRLPADLRRATLSAVITLGDDISLTAAGQARDLVQVALALRACDPKDRPALVRAMRSADARALARLGHSGLAAALAGWDERERGAAVGVLAAPAEAEQSRSGGLFLLLPLLAELPLATAAGGWPACRDVAAERVVAALALGAALGAGVAVLSDPWARLALGLPENLDRDIAGWSRLVRAEDRERLETALGPVLALRADAIAGDRHDESLLPGPPIAGPAAQAVRLAAAALLRELSYRLPGMALASASHLRRNVLTLDAQVRAGDQQVVVELGRAPLSMLLSVTGMNRHRFTLDATGDQTWVLTQR